jgi:thiamine pyrophosphate-dependent acetolactate synthase large subunit-like protein
MLGWQPSNSQALSAAVGRASDLLAEAKRPILLAGVHLRAYVRSMHSVSWPRRWAARWQ